MLSDGKAALALGDLCRTRWTRATGRHLPSPAPTVRRTVPWPSDVNADMEGIQVGISLTEPEYNLRPEVRHVERLYLVAIRAARRHIYIETTNMTSKTLETTLLERLRQRSVRLIVLILPPDSQGGRVQYTMDVLRGRVLKDLRAAHTCKRLGRYHPQIPRLATQCLSLHSKVRIVDNDFVRIGT